MITRANFLDGPKIAKEESGKTTRIDYPEKSIPGLGGMKVYKKKPI
jgi:hypothetical protein